MAPTLCCFMSLVSVSADRDLAINTEITTISKACKYFNNSSNVKDTLRLSDTIN